jgi:hypothetical protein
MAVSKNSCSICEKPFYGKQKGVRCGSCEIRLHFACLKIDDTRLAILAASACHHTGVKAGLSF